MEYLWSNSNFTINDEFIYNDRLLGFATIPNCNSRRAIELLNGDTIYKVLYSSDEYGRRVSEDTLKLDPHNLDSTQNKHAVFLGCSYTFGTGIAYNSTFPYLFEELNQDYCSYNYGLGGFGPHQSCLLFDDGINRINPTSIKQDSGMCLYTYIDDHLSRVYGSNQYFTFGANTPDVYIRNGQLAIEKRSSITKMLAYFCNNSETLKFFNIGFNYPGNEKFYTRFANIINYTAKKYWQIKPQGTFYVGLYPYIGCCNDTNWLKYLDSKIIVLDIPPPSDFKSNDEYIIAQDGHPAKKLNEYYSTEITKRIKEK